MGDQLGSCRSEVIVDLQAQSKEIFQVGSQKILAFHLRTAVAGNEKECPDGGFFQIWWLAIHHLDNKDAQTPNIHFEAVLLPGNDRQKKDIMKRWMKSQRFITNQAL